MAHLARIHYESNSTGGDGSLCYVSRYNTVAYSNQEVHTSNTSGMMDMVGGWALIAEIARSCSSMDRALCTK